MDKADDKKGQDGRVYKITRVPPRAVGKSYVGYTRYSSLIPNSSHLALLVLSALAASGRARTLQIPQLVLGTSRQC